MANTTFSGPVRSKAGFNVINESSTGVITETGFSVNATGQLISLGTRKSKPLLEPLLEQTLPLHTQTAMCLSNLEL